MLTAHSDNNDSQSRPPLTGALPAVAGLEVLEVIARGGHGTVYRAHQAEHDRIVALKVLDARLVDETARRRFDRERIALGRLSDHPSIVSLLDSGFTGSGVPYLLLELAPGGSLTDRLREGRLGLDEATRLAVGLAAATERAHQAGVVHRDIKPANILCSAYGEWMLTDFGIASIVDTSETQTVHVSYAHTAPENFDGGASAPTADVYSLASVIATCLTDVEPFRMKDDEIALSVVRRVASDPYPDLRSAGIPKGLAVVLEAALRKDPAERPQSAREFGEAINRFRLSNGLSPVPMRIGDDGVSQTTLPVVDLSEDLPIPSALQHRELRPGGSKVRVLIATALYFLLGLVLGGTVWSIYAPNSNDASGTSTAEINQLDDAGTEPATEVVADPEDGTDSPEFQSGIEPIQPVDGNDGGDGNGPNGGPGRGADGNGDRGGGGRGGPGRGN